MQSVFPVLQNSNTSFWCCRPADCYELLIFSIDYASLVILPLPMTVFPWEAVPAGAHSLVLSIPPCTGRFPSVKPFLPLLAAVTIFLCSLFCGYSLSAVPSSEKENPQISHDKSLVAAKSYQKQRVVCSSCTWMQRQILVRGTTNNSMCLPATSLASTNGVCMPWNAAIYG